MTVEKSVAGSSVLSSISIFLVFIVGAVISFISQVTDAYDGLGLFMTYIFIGSILLACLLASGPSKVFMIDTWISLLIYFVMCFLPIIGIQFIPLIYVVFTVMKSAKVIHAKLLSNCSRHRIFENRFYVTTAVLVTFFAVSQPYGRSDDNFLDNGLIDIALVVFLAVSTTIFSMSKNHLRYPALWFTYLAIAIFSSIKVGDEGGPYDLRAEAQVNAFRIISIISLVLIYVMFLRSGMFKYHQKPQRLATSSD